MMKIHPSAVPKNGTHIKWNLGVNDDARDANGRSHKTGIRASDVGGAGGDSTETM